MLILQLPRSHIPLYEADYEALRMKQATHMAAIHVSNNSLHLPPATRASARVSERLRLKLPVKPGAEIVRHSQRNKEQFVSLSPFDLAFPVHVRPVSTSVVLFSVSPFDTRFPSFRPHPSPRVTPHVTLDSHDLSPAVSFSPWDVRFPKSSFHRKHHRKSHNRSFQKRLRLQAAVAQYRRERGPAQDRPLFDLKSREVKTLDPSSFLSFSPWQETDFALACGVKLDKFIAARNLKQAVKAASGQRRAKQIKNAQKKLKRYYSFSPFDSRFPNFSVKMSNSQQLVLVKKPQTLLAAAFPAFSPLARQTPAAFPQTQTQTTNNSAVKTPNRQPSIPMH